MHRTARRFTDAVLFCTNLTNLINIYVRNTRNQQKLLLHGSSFYTDDSFYTDFINEHGTARRFTEVEGTLDGNVHFVRIYPN